MLRSVSLSVAFRRTFTAAAQVKPRTDSVEGIAPAPLTQLSEEELALKDTGTI